MNPQLAQWLKTLQTHPWLGHALGVVLLLVAANTYFNLQASNALIQKQAAQLALQKARLEAISQRVVPVQQISEIRSRLALLEGQLGQAPTAAIAQANIQDKLNLLVRARSLQNARVQVGSLEPVAGHPSLAEIKAQLDYVFTPENLLPLLVALSTQTPAPVITDLSFQNQANSRVSVGASYYFPTINTNEK